MAAKEYGRRPYVNTRKGYRGGYVEDMARETEKGKADYYESNNYFIKQSEFKRPYQSPNYQGMEHYVDPENPPYIPPPPPPERPPYYPPTPPPPVEPINPVVPPPERPILPPEVPPTGTCQGCWGPMNIEQYCRDGAPITITPAITCPDDPIVAVTVSGGGDGAASTSGSSVTYNPGSSSGAFLTMHTKSGLECYAVVSAKDDSECEEPTPGVDCTTVTITYTTNQMALGEQQTLSIDPPECDCEWSLEGGGSISGSGSSITYTAPATNENCLSNPTITITCDGLVKDTLQMAVADDSLHACIAAGTAGHYRDYTYDVCSGAGWCCYYYYNCMGEICVAGCGASSVYCTSYYPDSWVVGEYPIPCSSSGSCTAVPVDLRSEAQKAAGCCPAQAL